jgi:sodium pump decarboxylase gamma subunit
MKKNRKRKAGILAAAVCLASALLAVPAAAEMTEESGEALALNVRDYLENQVFAMPEEYYDAVRSQGSFYAIMVDQLETAREDAGEYVSLGEVQVDASDDAIVCTADAEFEKYDAEVVMTFDASGQTPENFEINVDFPLSERMSEAGMHTIIGLVVVFAILFFLTGVIYLFRYMHRDSGQEKKPEEKPARRQAEAPAAPAAAAVPAAPQEDVELAIVLAAAIAMAEEESPSGDGYVVRSVRKAGTSRRWKRV